MDELELNEQQKAKLDNIVAKMVENKESDSDIQFVVDDFKSKYGSPKSDALSTQGGKSGAVSSSQVPPSKESTSVLDDIESESQSWKKPLQTQTQTKPAETPVQQPLVMKQQPQAKQAIPKVEVSKPEEKELGAWESIVNSTKNIATQIKTSIPNSVLAITSIEDRIIGEAARVAAKLQGATSEQAEYISKSYPKAITAAGSELIPSVFIPVEKTRKEAYKKIDELKKEFRPTKGIIETYKKGDLKGLAAAGYDAVTSLVSSMATGLTTGGVGTFTDMVGSSIYEYNKEKAKSLGVSVDELYDKGKDEVAIPVVIGGIGASLERIGLEGINKAISTNITRRGVRGVIELVFEGGKEAGTEWIQTGLEEFNKALARGESAENASKIAWNTMTSEQGIESALKGLVGSGISVASGKAANSMFSIAKERRKNKIKPEVEKVNTFASELQNPNLDETTRSIIENEINNTTQNIKSQVKEDLIDDINISDEASSKIQNIESRQDDLKKEYETKKALLENPNLSPQTKSILSSEVIRLEGEIGKLDSERDLVLTDDKNKPQAQPQAQPQQALEKYTASTPEKYGYIDRGDGKGKVELTEEEFLAEQAKMQPQGEVETEQPPISKKINVLGKEIDMYENYIPSADKVDPNAVYTFTSDSEGGIPSLLQERAKLSSKGTINGKASEKWTASINGNELIELYNKRKTEQPASVTEQEELKLTGEEVKNKLQEIEKQPVKINITQDANGKMEQTSQEVIDNIKSELDKTGLPYSDVVSNDKGSTYFVVTKDGQQHEILKVLQSGGSLVPTNLTKAKWINHLIKTEKESVVKAVEDLLAPKTTKAEKPVTIVPSVQTPTVEQPTTTEQKQNEKEPTKTKNGEPMPEGVQGVRTEGEGGQESTELRAEKEKVATQAGSVVGGEKLKPIENYIGDNPKVYNSARNWNEDIFSQEGSDWEDSEVSDVIHETPYRKTYFGRIGSVDAKTQYAIAPDTKFNNRQLLLAREVGKDGKVIMDWYAVGEYDGGNMGILESQRGKGAGTSFAKELIKKDILKPSIGYSPEGLATVKKAYAELSKEQSLQSTPTSQEKVSGGLTQEEKTNLETIAKEAGVNFQEVRNVYNKYGEGKPLSEITLEDYQKAQEKRDKGKEVKTEEGKQITKEKLWSKIRAYNNLSKTEKKSAYGSKLRSEIMSEANSLNYTISPTKQGKFILLDDKGKQVRAIGTPRSKDEIKEEKRLKERRDRARREIPISIKHSIAQDIANGVKFDREEFKRITGLSDADIPFWLTTKKNGASLEFYFQTLQEKGFYQEDVGMDFASEVADAISEFANRKGRTTALEFIEKQQEIIENGGYTDAEIQEQVDMYQAKLDEENFDYFAEYLSQLSPEEAQQLADELAEAEKLQNQVLINEILTENEKQNKPTEGQGEQKLDTQALDIERESKEREAEIAKTEDKIKELEKSVAKKQKQADKLREESQGDIFGGTKVQMFDTTEELKQLTKEIREQNSEIERQKEKLANLKEKQTEASNQLKLIEEPLSSVQEAKSGVQEGEEKVAEGGVTAPSSELFSLEPIDFSVEIEKLYGVTLDLLGKKNKGDLTLSKIVVPESIRNKGVGSEVMKMIIDYANKNGRRLVLTPSLDFGASSIKRLTDFYKGFGFVENKGKNKDYTTKELLYKNPEINETTQKEINELFDAYESIEDSKGMDKRKAAEQFRNMQQSIKNPILKRIFDNISDIHSQLEKQGLITKTKGCP